MPAPAQGAPQRLHVAPGEGQPDEGEDQGRPQLGRDAGQPGDVAGQQGEGDDEGGAAEEPGGQARQWCRSIHQTVPSVASDAVPEPRR